MQEVTEKYIYDEQTATGSAPSYGMRLVAERLMQFREMRDLSRYAV